jgi:hypothetical protein
MSALSLIGSDVVQGASFVTCAGQWLGIVLISRCIPAGADERELAWQLLRLKWKALSTAFLVHGYYAYIMVVEVFGPGPIQTERVATRKYVMVSEPAAR